MNEFTNLAMAKSKEKKEASINPENQDRQNPDNSTADSAYMAEKSKEADKARKAEENKGGEIEYWRNEFKKAWPAESIKKVGKVLKKATPTNIKEGAKALPSYAWEGTKSTAKASPRYAWEGIKETALATSGILTDTAWKGVKASWKFVKKMAWGIVTLNPPKAKDMYKEIRSAFNEEEKKEKK